MSINFVPTDVENRNDDGPDVLTLNATFDGFPIEAKITFIDPVSVLEFFKRMGTDDSLYGLAESMLEVLEAAEDEQDL